jgi:lipoprotein-anchoring transpeptidase ErfK/SrfK
MVSLCCDIVSGKPGVNGTPQMICYVYKKQKAAILRGDNYASYVDYWMPIYKGIGLHDASWQREFGGERYLTHGSHGCINLKKADAKYIYDHIEVGIPVILYY